jgi:hypothetical protein
MGIPRGEADGLRNNWRTVKRMSIKREQRISRSLIDLRRTVRQERDGETGIPLRRNWSTVRNVADEHFSSGG